MKKYRRRNYVKAIRTEKRKGEVGEKIIVVKPCYTEDFKEHKIGEIYTVRDVFTASIYTTTGIGLWDWEYRVIS